MITMRLSDKRGFALPMAILVIALLTISLAASFTMLGAERQGMDNDRAGQQAFQLGETGLQRFLAKRDSLQVWVADSAQWILASAMTVSGPVRIDPG